MNPEHIYIDVKTVAEIRGVTPRAVRIALKQGKYEYRETQGGKAYEIKLSSLPTKEQETYKNLYYSQIVRLETEIVEEKELPLNKELPINNEDKFIPEQALKIALSRFDLITEWQNFRKKHHPKTKADKEFLDLYNSGEYLKNIFANIGKTSRGSLQRWQRVYEEYGTVESLAPQYRYKSFNEYNTVLTEEEIGIFLKILLHPNQFSIGKAIKLTRHILQKCGAESLPQPITFRRYAVWFRKNNYDKWTLMREGEKALRDNVMPYIKRDISKLSVGQVLVADGKVLNFLVINPFTGRPSRATLVGFLDWKSGYLAGYEIMLTENTQCIASALRSAILNMDMIPEIVYQDNGRAFRAKYFGNSANFEESGFNGIYTGLGIRPVYASHIMQEQKL